MGQREGRGSDDLIGDAYLSGLDDGSVVAITSKIVAICQGRVVPIGMVDMHSLITQEADYFLAPDP